MTQNDLLGLVRTILGILYKNLYKFPAVLSRDYSITTSIYGSLPLIIQLRTLENYTIFSITWVLEDPETYKFTGVSKAVGKVIQNWYNNLGKTKS